MSAPATESDPPPASPDVITFPPIIFAAFFAIGYVTDLAFPVAPDAAVLRYAAGAVLVVLSTTLVLWAGSRFVRARTPVDVRKPATALVTDGPYRLSRNPMYLAASLLYAGAAILGSLPWTLLLLAPCLVVIQIGIIRPEERHLEERFGDAYRDYKGRVRRWL
jgi:protein-S-isoprenylcysteine O-methyltransferase Ste14